MSRRHHHHLQPYDYDRFSEHSRDRDNRERDQTRGIEYQDDSLSSINSDEDNYLHHQHKDKKGSFYNSKNDATSTSKGSKSDKPANNESYHQKDMKPQPQSQRAGTSNNPDTTSERLGRLEAMLEQLIKRSLLPVETQPVVNVPAAPEKTSSERRGQFALEPRRHDFTTSMWINKIQEVSVQNNWDEKTTISFMGSQMSGIIKAWYNSLPSYDYTWPEWKILISKVFPDNTDFVTSLKRLVTRLKQAEETMANYYFSKMYLIEACKITGEDAVSCLIDGLNNQSIQEQAKLQNYLTPETLYSQFLMILPEYTVDYTPGISSGSDPLNNWYYPDQNQSIEEITTEIEAPEQVFEFETGPGAEDSDYRAQGNKDFRGNDETERSLNSPPKRSVPVHSRLDKRFIRPNNFRYQNNKIPMAAKVCTICNNRGHLARNCRRADKIMYFKMHNSPQGTTFLKTCMVNDVEMMGFVDTGCSTVTIRERESRDLDLEILPKQNCVEVYGGGLVQTLGATKFMLAVDSVQIQVEAVIVPDHVQDVAVVVGQGFLNQKNLCMFLQSGRLKIFEASNKLTN